MKSLTPTESSNWTLWAICQSLNELKLLTCLLVVSCVSARPKNECAGIKAKEYVMCDEGDGICKPVREDIPGHGNGQMMCCPLSQIECQNYYYAGR